MRKLFGTDGVRGIANELLTPELSCALAQACARAISDRQSQTGRPFVLVGRDTRRSGPMLEAAIAAGFCSMGYDVHSLGIVPTPVVAWLVRQAAAAGGVMISASHNPAPDNGIKFFDGNGEKLSDERESAIEALLGDSQLDQARVTGAAVGEVFSGYSTAAYQQAMLATLPVDLGGLRIAVDTAYGATYQLAPELLARAGLQVHALHTDFDGMNINRQCGSTHLEPLIAAMEQGDFDCGVAFDGDGDRCLAVTPSGRVVDGDQIMYFCLRYLPYLQGAEGLAATVMSNLGVEQALARAGQRLIRAQVGDRYVLEAMKQHGLRLGGEQSGHLIFRDHQVTGDGILTALQLLSALRLSGQSLDSLLDQVPLCPQTLLNVPVAPQHKHSWQENPRIQDTIRRCEQELGSAGRILVRASGTEPKIRIMLEGPEQGYIEAMAAAIAQDIRAELA